MDEEQQVPQIRRLEEGEKMNFILPECCRLFAEADPTDRDYQKLEENCPHVPKKAKPTKRNIGL